MPPLNLTDQELAHLDYHLSTMRDGIDPDLMLAGIHDKVRDLQGRPRRGRNQAEKDAMEGS